MVRFRENYFRQKIIAYLAVLLAAGSCANIGAPTGGPKDVTPPVVLYSEPPSYSVNFSGDQIRIIFDEYIQLRGLSQKLFISPPLEQSPDIRVRGRWLVINLREKLRDNTTYRFFFGDAIVDFTEGNAIPGFTYVVATGPYVDSLSLSGNVIEAFTLKAADGVFVMLYDNHADSVPLLEFPSYVALTDKSGSYTINNIRQGKFKIFALRDKNANFKFDLPDEAVGFLDSLVVPTFDFSKLQTTTTRVAQGADGGVGEKTETEPEANESNQDIKPLIEIPEPATKPPPKYNLVLFTHADTLQRVTATPMAHGAVRFFFRQPFRNISIKDLSGSLPEKWNYAESSRNKDTLTLYLIPPIKDSIYVEIADNGVVIDSMRAATRPRVVRTRETTQAAETKLQVQFNLGRAQSLHYNENLKISTGSLIDAFDSSLFKMWEVEDSLYIDSKFEIDSLTPRHLLSKTPLEAGKKYQLVIFSGAITDVFGNTNDSIVINFSTTKPSDYSSLTVNLQVPDPAGLYVLQLLNRENRVLAEQTIGKAGSVTFSHLVAGAYGLRLINDLNGNQTWDTGNYHARIQPEPVYIFGEIIQIRQNWEAEISWVVNK